MTESTPGPTGFPPAGATPATPAPQAPPAPPLPEYSPYAPPGYHQQSWTPATDTLTVAPAPADGGPADPPTQTADPAERRPRRTVALVLATALVAGGIGGGVGAVVATRDGGTTTVTSLTSGSSGTPAKVTLPEGSVESVAAKVLPSVVSITERSADGSGGEGSGIVLSSDGLILTNNHVVAESVDGGDRCRSPSTTAPPSTPPSSAATRPRTWP